MIFTIVLHIIWNIIWNILPMWRKIGWRQGNFSTGIIILIISIVFIIVENFIILIVTFIFVGRIYPVPWVLSSCLSLTCSLILNYFLFFLVFSHSLSNISYWQLCVNSATTEAWGDYSIDSQCFTCFFCMKWCFNPFLSFGIMYF